MKTDLSNYVYLKDYQKTEYVISEVDLVFKLDPEKTIVQNKMRIERRHQTDAGTTLVLDGDELTFISAQVNGQSLNEGQFEASANSFRLLTPPADEFELTITTQVNPSANTQLSGLYLSSGNYCTQCEAEGFRRITYFYDRPDSLAIYKTRIEALKAKYPVLLANGNPLTSGDMDAGYHFAEWLDPHPKPSYLFALVAGDLGRVSAPYTTASGRNVALNIYVEHGNEPRSTYAMDCLIRSMKWDEERFGREYDLDVFNIVAVSDFNMGAMENKGLNIFNDKYILADPKVATDADYEGIETVVAHEYFHNWTGNRITCRDWFQLCLKEGLTVFRDQEFSSDERSRSVQRIQNVRSLKSRQFPEDSGPLAHPVRPDTYKEINNFYTATVYQKGSELCGMLQTLLGIDGFRKGMDLYFERHDGDAATIEDFLACFAESSQINLDQFALWYHQSGTPLLKVTRLYNRDRQELSLTISQELAPTPGQEKKEPMLIPIRFGLLAKTGDEQAFSAIRGAKVKDDVIWLENATQTIVFEGVSEGCVPSLLRGFSAPVNIESDLNSFEKLLLMQHDCDGFSKWQALQDVAGDILVKLSVGQEAPELDAFTEALAAIIGDDSLEYAFRALCLQMPSHDDLVPHLSGKYDPEAVYQAKLKLRKQITKRLLPLFETIYSEVKPASPFNPDATSAGARSLRNTIVSYLGISSDQRHHELVVKHFENADNMSDQISALITLVHDQITGYEVALQQFYEMHKNTPLALDKWFAAQASSPTSSGVEMLECLAQDPAFSWGTPNRVRALLDPFTIGNPRLFNKADGSSYKYLAQKVLEIDTKNPQLAARVLNAFRSWQHLEPTRRQLARQALASILDAKQAISIDIRDITERCLQ
ncbi:aminopeptidase N [Polycladidibacter stylochi]|uniref:aminopeptidase N n=1 Tax=Polycladidibacter stylochi TaxID=1807766 RepID=UPI0008366ED9|nr:aminopeptidase N [Pseudovibrio stylochi]